MLMPVFSVRPVSHLSEHYTIFDEDRDLIALTSIQDHLSREIDAAKNKLMKLENEAGLNVAL